jgi:hypothetical protein
MVALQLADFLCAPVLLEIFCVAFALPENGWIPAEKVSRRALLPNRC